MNLKDYGSTKRKSRTNLTIQDANAQQLLQIKQEFQKIKEQRQLRKKSKVERKKLFLIIKEK